MTHSPTTSENTPVALVTGACSGIGLEYARQLAALGYRLVLVSNRAEAIREAAEALTARYSATTYPFCIDLARPEAAETLYNRCREQGLEISVLINNAGIFSFNDLTRTPAAAVETMLNLHVLTVTQLCRIFGRRMQERKAGYILNMSSLSAWTPFPGIATYAATKAYLRSFTRSFGLEMQPHGVSVLAVCPGAVATDLYRLAPRYQKLGVRLGILMTPERMVRKALRALFRKKHQQIPGAINRLFIPVVAAMPRPLIRFVKRKISRYER